MIVYDQPDEKSVLLVFEASELTLQKNEKLRYTGRFEASIPDRLAFELIRMIQNKLNAREDEEE
jgi:hypothetical protein